MMPALTQLLLAAMFGGMLIFSLLFAPLVFTKLAPETAGRFIRAVFPWYYAWVLLFSALAAGALWLLGAGTAQVALAAAIAAGAVVSRWPLMSHINALRDRQLAGDAAAGRSFDRMHRLSVVINLAQLVAAAALVGLLAAGR